MIQANNLTKYYGPKAAIQDVTFNVQPGEILGFLGPNAAGKTTTMRILIGFLPATSGSAQLAGYDVRRLPMSSLCSGWSLAWPLQLKPEHVPNR